MNPKASFGNRFHSKLPGIIPSAALSELEFHNKVAVKPMFLKSQSTNIDWFAGKDENGQWEEYIFLP